MRRRVRVILWMMLAGLLGVGGWLYSLVHDLPDPTGALTEMPRPPGVRVVDRQGRLLYATSPGGEGRFEPLSPDDLPSCLKQATIAVEDATFYTNPGVDPIAVVRALWLNLRAGRIVTGGSTITQQVVRNVLLPPGERHERTWRRKVREAWLAWRLTRSASKEQILALYLNTTYYGAMAYGAEAAAQTFFGKSARDLTLPECALLAGLPQSPAAYDPFVHPEAARRRQRVVLDLMVRRGFITAQERDRAFAVPLDLNPRPYPLEAPHAVWLTLAWLATERQRRSWPADVALEVQLTLDLDRQHQAEAALHRHLARLQAQGREVTNGAVVVLRATTGEVVALVGSADFSDPYVHGAVNMAVHPRPTGSAFKPIIYALALSPERPEPWTEATVLWDLRTVFYTHDGRPYVPHNYDLREHGPVTLRQALASSLNIPAVQTLAHVGLSATVAQAHRLDLPLASSREYDLALALGGAELSLLRLSAAYTAFADQGRYHPAWWVLRVRRLDTGQVLYQGRPLPPRQVWDPRVAWLISDILSDDTARSLGFGRHSSLEMGFPAAVKTGTSSGFHDNWTIGYTPDWVVGVWVGHADFRALRGVDGLTGAAPIWHDVLQALVRTPRPFRQPPGLVAREVCTFTGLLPEPACPHTHRAWFLQGTEPTRTAGVFHRIWLDTLTGALAGPETPPARRQARWAWDLTDPRTQAWAREHGWLVWADWHARVAPDTTAAPAAVTTPSPWLLRPENGAVYRLDPSLPSAGQRLLIEAVAPAGTARLRLWADGTLLADFRSPPYRAWWPLQAGAHRFWAEAWLTDGRRVTSRPTQIRVEPPGTPRPP